MFEQFSERQRGWRCPEWSKGQDVPNGLPALHVRCSCRLYVFYFWNFNRRKHEIFAIILHAFSIFNFEMFRPCQRLIFFLSNFRRQWVYHQRWSLLFEPLSTPAPSTHQSFPTQPNLIFTTLTLYIYLVSRIILHHSKRFLHHTTITKPF